jgi:hypothetical protein
MAAQWIFKLIFWCAATPYSETLCVIFMKKVILIIIGIGWLTLWLLWALIFGLNEVPNQISKNREFKDAELVPLVNKVDSFLTTHGRLPTEGEFNKMYRTLTHLPTVEYYQADSFEGIPELKQAERGTKNYVVVVWRGEWNEYYTSWNQHYSVDDFQSSNGIYNLLLSLVIGGLPLLLIIRFVK